MPVGDRREELIAGYRRADQEALHVLATEFGQHLPFIDGLDALGDDGEMQFAREIEACLDHCALARLRWCAADETAVDLQLGERDLRQLRERRVAGSEIVDRQAEALQAQACEHIEHVRRFAHAVVDRQSESRRDLVERALQLRSDVQARVGGLRLAGRDRDGR